ncbi:sensor histidine kinase [Robbsia andropogonis]|uniref:sensor histidine kinase n=1 Tax=Robbsia andropogonis TaxID=28092 RepID=UPI000A91B837
MKLDLGRRVLLERAERLLRIPFSTQLTALWILVAFLCALLTAAVWLMLFSALGERIATVKLQAGEACTTVAARYDVSAQRPGAVDVDLMHAVLDLVLIRMDGIEGGFWADASVAGVPEGFLAYAFPTYEGSGVKRDIPEAETPLIVRTLKNVARTGKTQTDSVASGADAVIAVACPVPHHPGLFAWTLVRARPPLGPYGERAVTVLASVLAIIAVLALLLAMALRRWRRNLVRLEGALEPAGGLGQGGRLEPLGEPDLDHIVHAFNRYVERAERLQREKETLSAQLTQAERFSLLGKMAAQIAHEIRNPVGAMRLKAENALAGDDARREAALQTIVGQIGRIEAQMSSLLALTQPVTIHARDVDLGGWLHDIGQVHDASAQSRHVTLTVESEPVTTMPAFDPAQLARALDNLIVNALQHARQGGQVTVRASVLESEEGKRLRFEVIDDGPGVGKIERERIFEPFVTGRPQGSGLGLAVVREIALAHRGRVWLAEDSVTRFVIELPWRPY